MRGRDNILYYPNIEDISSTSLTVILEFCSRSKTDWNCNYCIENNQVFKPIGNNKKKKENFEDENDEIPRDEIFEKNFYPGYCLK